MINIREYQSDDVAITWDLKFSTIRKVNIQDYTEAQTQAWAPDNFDMALWQKRVHDMKPFIAEINGQVVGFADLQKEGYIDHFFCHSDYQGIGVGKALMQHILETGRANGVTCFYSHVSLTAKSFFEHFGFKEVKQQQVNINDQQLTNFVMEKHF